MPPNVGAGGVVVCRALQYHERFTWGTPRRTQNPNGAISFPSAHTHTRTELKEVLNGAATVTHEIFRFSNMNISYDQHKATYGNMNA